MIVDEAGTAQEAEARIRAAPPDVIVLDLRLPGRGGAELCAQLKGDARTRAIPIILLTGAEPEVARRAQAAGAEALLYKPFSPLELVALVERMTGRGPGPLRQPRTVPTAQEELILYARDLRHVLEVERRQRDLLQQSYLATVRALTSTLEQKDTGTSAHSVRVQAYALALLQAVDPDLADREQGLQFGFLLHDIGKLAIPDRILQKASPLTAKEAARMRCHPVIGERMLQDVALLAGEPLRVVRSHHERWDGHGYPDGLAGPKIPIAARVFGLADALDAMTTNRPYRWARSWEAAHAEIAAEAGRQFDPGVVQAFVKNESELRRIRRGLAAA